MSVAIAYNNSCRTYLLLRRHRKPSTAMNNILCQFSQSRIECPTWDYLNENCLGISSQKRIHHDQDLPLACENVLQTPKVLCTKHIPNELLPNTGQSCRGECESKKRIWDQSLCSCNAGKYAVEACRGTPVGFRILWLRVALVWQDLACWELSML